MYEEGQILIIIMDAEESAKLFNILSALVLVIVVLLILVGNIFVLIIVRQVDNSVFSDVTKLFMRSLTVSDLFVGIFIVLPNIGRRYNGGEWPSAYGEQFPLVYLKVHILVLISGLLSLLVITVERYMAVSWSLRYHILMTQKKARIIVAVVWTVSIIFSISATDSTGEPSDTEDLSDYNSTISQFASSTVNGDAIDEDVGENTGAGTVSLWTNFTLLVALPIITIMILSVKLYAIARRHARRINEQQRQFVVTKKDYKGAVTFIIVAGGFAVAWLPNFILSLYLQYTKSDVSQVLNYFVRLCIYCNSWWNVLIYYARNRSFREATRKFMGANGRWFGLGSNAVGDSAFSADLANASNTEVVESRNETVPSIQIS